MTSSTQCGARNLVLAGLAARDLDLLLRHLRTLELSTACELARHGEAGLLFIESYRDLPLLAWPRLLIDAIVELEEQLVLWRTRHARLLGWLAAAPAMAQETSRLMRPGHLDVHAEGGLSFIPPSMPFSIIASRSATD